MLRTSKLSFSALVLCLLLSVVSIKSFAAVDTVLTYSTAMEKQIKAVVVTPTDYEPSNSYPVVYILHGYSGDYTYYAKNIPQLQDYVDQYQLIVVTPDGNYGSWYWDSPVVKESKYETYVGKELVAFIDQNYSTLASREGRAITGLSMGGHGAFYLAFRHQETYGAAGSMSGGLDIGPFPENWEMKKYLGTKAEFPARWEEYSVMHQAKRLIPNKLQLIFHCGTEDFFYDANVKFHELLRYNKIPHTFTSNPGGHNLKYWAEALPYQLLFFHNYFTSQQ